MAQDTVVLRPRGVGKGAAKACRRDNLVPGVIYGKTVEPVAVALDQRAVKKIMGGSGGHIHHVSVENTSFEGNVMVQDAVYDPVSRTPLHVDLHRISLTEKVKTEVPIAVTGDEELEKRGFILQRQLREITVECLPTVIPDSILVSVSELEPGAAITAGDLEIPPGVRLVTAPQEVVLVAVTPRSAEEKEEEEPEEGAEGAEPTPDKPEGL